jgi:hypothetical protein
MKTLKTIYFSLLLTLCVSAIAQAQEYKYSAKSANKIKILANSGSFKIEGYAGKEIYINGPSSKIPDEAEGLKLINGGLNDNTGEGMYLEEEGNEVIIRNVARSGDFTLRVPENINLHVIAKSYNCGKITISNFKGELELKSDYAGVTLDNVTGPVVCNATYGGVKANFNKVNQEKPISIISTYSKVDVSLPENTKANLSLESSYGNIYSDLDIAYEKKGIDEESTWGGKNIKGKVNGGGVDIYLKSPYSNIYLRKSK